MLEFYVKHWKNASGDDNSMKKTTKVGLTLAVLTATTVIAIGPIRLHKAGKQADAFAAEKGIIIEYENIDHISSKEALLTEIRQIALWEEDTRTEINDTFGQTDKEYKEGDFESKSGYEKEEELLEYAMKEKWRKLRNELDRQVTEAITHSFQNADSSYGLEEEYVQICHEEDCFGTVNEVMQAVDEGAGMEAYNLARNGLGEEWSALPMDIAYGIRPKLIKAGCEATLLSIAKSTDLYEVRSTVDSAEKFSERYQITIDGLDSAKKKEERLEYNNKPDIPAVGMSTSQARSTKLGSPTRTSTESGSWGHMKHTYGEMYWDRGGKQIFKAHYYDGEITDVWDTRNSTATSPWVSSRSSSSKTYFDPDDHDIEAYYEDNRDEYNDYDDAYEGFLDDEGVWDDY